MKKTALSLALLTLCFASAESIPLTSNSESLPQIDLLTNEIAYPVTNKITERPFQEIYRSIPREDKHQNIRLDYIGAKPIKGKIYYTFDEMNDHHFAFHVDAEEMKHLPQKIETYDINGFGGNLEWAMEVYNIDTDISTPQFIEEQCEVSADATLLVTGLLYDFISESDASLFYMDVGQVLETGPYHKRCNILGF